MSVITLTHNEVVAAVREYVHGHYIHSPWLLGADVADVTLMHGKTELSEGVRADVVVITQDSLPEKA